MSTIWGYVRVSTAKQKLERQIENIKRVYPDAVIITEAYTGTTMDRPRWQGLVKQLKPGDTVVFDEVSRMCRNAQEGMELYERLFDDHINLVFLKEPHINSSVYRQSMDVQVAKQAETGRASTDKLISAITDALHDYMIDVAREQIQLAFETAQHEIDFLHQRTREGVRKAQADGKIVGRPAGVCIETKKAKFCKPKIRELSKSFGGNLNDEDMRKLLGISYGSLYKYKRELKNEEYRK